MNVGDTAKIKRAIEVFANSSNGGLIVTGSAGWRRKWLSVDLRGTRFKDPDPCAVRHGQMERFDNI